MKDDLFPLSSPDVIHLVAEARKRIAKMDRVDRKTGSPTPIETPLDSHLRTVILALECSMSMKNWAVAAEAMAMLQEAEVISRRAWLVTERELRKLIYEESRRIIDEKLSGKRKPPEA